MDINKKKEEAESYLEKIIKEINTQEQNLIQLKEARLQLIGRIQTYAEILEDANGKLEVSPVEPIQTEIVD